MSYQLISLYLVPPCSCGSLKVLIENQQQERVMQFLMWIPTRGSAVKYFWWNPFLTLRKFKTRSFKKKGSTCLRPLRFLLVMVHLLLMLAVLSLWAVYLLLHHNRLTPLLVAAGSYQHSNPVWFREKKKQSTIPKQSAAGVQYRQPTNASRPRRERPRCDHCGKLGHVKSKCYSHHGYTPWSANTAQSSPLDNSSWASAAAPPGYSNFRPLFAEWKPASSINSSSCRGTNSPDFIAPLGVFDGSKPHDGAYLASSSCGIPCIFL